MDEIDLARLRRSYESAQLGEETLAADPIRQLERWLKDAQAAGVAEVNAMCVCTDDNGSPSARMVLLRGLDERGLIFYTSYNSRKGRELEKNPRAAALFYWPQLERQVRVEGVTSRLSEDESDRYFASRPRGHQIGAWASEQSEIIEERGLLEQRARDYDARFEDQDVPRPHSWGGFVVKPSRFEFWQGRPNRMHDRLEYIASGERWTLRRLQP